MTSGWLLQLFFDLLMIVALVVVWQRLRRPAQEDPRLSRGLQLLQSKIAVLEDLSDRTDAQVRQLGNLLEQKARQLQNKIIEAEHQIQRVDASMKRSKEVAEIFQDRIPHEEIIERQNTVKYVKAAQLAHAGKPVEEIAKEVGLPVGQVEMIAKVNQGQLRFDETQLPEWARPSADSGQALHEESLGFELSDKDMIESHSVIKGSTPQDELADPMASAPEVGGYESLKKLGEEFRQAVRQQAQTMESQVNHGAPTPGPKVIRKEISRIQFPRVDIQKNLS